jgi:hypothetical protein
VYTLAVLNVEAFVIALETIPDDAASGFDHGDAQPVFGWPIAAGLMANGQYQTVGVVRL